MKDTPSTMLQKQHQKSKGVSEPMVNLLKKKKEGLKQGMSKKDQGVKDTEPVKDLKIVPSVKEGKVPPQISI